MKNKLFRALKNGAASPAGRLCAAGGLRPVRRRRRHGRARRPLLQGRPAAVSSSRRGKSAVSQKLVLESASSQESTASGSSAASSAPSSGAEKESAYLVEAADAPDVAGMECEGKMKLEYAECFDVYYYEGWLCS